MGFRDWFRRPAQVATKAKRAMRSVFAGASTGRLFEDWIASWMSPQDENKYELRLLRNRAREQCRNNPLARRYLGLCDEQILGPKGITLQARNRLTTGEPDEETNQQIETAWAAWGERGVCTADGRYSWRGFHGAALEARKRDGEALVELLYGFPNRFGFAVRLLDIDLLDETYNVPANQNGGNAIVQSVEINEYGREVAFHVWTQHPMETMTQGQRKRVRIPATRMLHLGRPRRAGQTRYEPALTPVLTPLRMLDEYLNAELAAARAAAETPAFIQKSENAPGPDPDDPMAGVLRLETAKGTLQELAPGETLATWPSEHPNAVLPAFVREVKAHTAAGLHVAYASLTGDMSQSNYSSSRMALTPERDHWRIEQQQEIDDFCMPIFRAWLRQAVIWQQIRLPGPYADYQWAEWEPRGFDYVDPEKDITASLMEVEAGLNSLTRVAAGQGRDLRAILMERKAELDLAEELGVTLVTGKPLAVQTNDLTDTTGGTAEAPAKEAADA